MAQIVVAKEGMFPAHIFSPWVGELKQGRLAVPPAAGTHSAILFSVWRATHLQQDK